jgi:serine/threonine protein kinase/Tfp pilus assembly protein PilF
MENGTRLGSIAVCSVCGERLNAKGDCRACLVRTGLGETADETKSSALVFGDFEIEQNADGTYSELGRGAIGVTYLAVDRVLRRRVALKVIEVPAGADGSQFARQRFLREARAAAALRHPNVAGVYQFGTSPDGSHCYYAMELVEGETLGARVRRDGPFNAKEAMEIAIQITRALMAAAAHDLIHRDLKPGNIMLTTESEVKVIDFGLAKAITDAGGDMDLTHGEFVGTPSFASPEQFESGPVDARSDIYSLGATLWFALTGLAPHFGKTMEEIRASKIGDDLPVAQLVTRKVPEPLVKLLRSTLAIDPGKRPASARELMEALESCRRKLTPGVPYQKPSLRSEAFYVVVVVALLSVGLFLLGRYSAPNEQKASALPRKSIAVLPFVNMSSDQENVYFVDGLTEEILSRLAEVRDLKVPGRTSSFAFKSQNRDLREVGSALGVANVLEGSVRKSGDRLRITAQLIRTQDGYRLWSQAFDRKVDDVFAIQEEIARAIASALSVQLNLSVSEKAQRPTQDMQAYDSYLEARTLITRRDTENLRRAITLLEGTVQRDPDFAKAWAALAQAQALTSYYCVAPRKESLEAAESAARKALSIDEATDLAHAVLANVLRDRFDWLPAETEFRRALELNPGEAETHNQYGQLLLRVGHLEGAFQQISRARELEPLGWVPVSMMGLGYLIRGELPKSAEMLERAQKLVEPTPSYLIDLKLVVALTKHDKVGARQALAQARSSLGIWSLQANQQAIEAMDTALVYFRSPTGASPDLTKVIEEGDAFYMPSLAAAAMYTEQKELALDALVSSFRSRYVIDLTQMWTPIFYPLRTEPRFRELVRAAKLPEYWRVAGWGEFCHPKGANDFECAVP